MIHGKYNNRVEAGRVLADQIESCGCSYDTIVLGLPRGGVIVAYEVAKILQVPVDIMIVRKIGAPDQPELAIGAIATGGVQVLNEPLIHELNLHEKTIDRLIDHENLTLIQKQQAYMGDRPHPELEGEQVVIIDDGLATGATMKAAVLAAQARQAKEVIVAVPVGPTDTIEALAHIADKVICPLQPHDFSSVGQWYQHFEQVDDQQVIDTLTMAG